MARVLVVVCALLTGCSAGPVVKSTPGPGDRPGYIAPDVDARAVTFRGSCSWGRAPGEASRYPVQVLVHGAPGEGTTVYADAELGALGPGYELGILDAGATPSAAGPVRGTYAQEPGYAVLVRGHTGRVCRGYVRAAAVRVLGQVAR